MPHVFLNTKHFQKLLELFKVKNIEELRSVLDNNNTVPFSEMTEEVKYISLRNKHLDKKIIRIDIQNKMDLITKLHLSPSIAVEVAAGRIPVQVALNPTFSDSLKYESDETMKQLEKELNPNKISWVHFCKAAGREVEFIMNVSECKFCGASSNG